MGCGTRRRLEGDRVDEFEGGAGDGACSESAGWWEGSR